MGDSPDRYKASTDATPYSSPVRDTADRSTGHPGGLVHGGVPAGDVDLVSRAGLVPAGSSWPHRSCHQPARKTDSWEHHVRQPASRRRARRRRRRRSRLRRARLRHWRHGGPRRRWPVHHEPQPARLRGPPRLTGRQGLGQGQGRPPGLLRRAAEHLQGAGHLGRQGLQRQRGAADGARHRQGDVRGQGAREEVPRGAGARLRQPADRRLPAAGAEDRRPQRPPGLAVHRR